MRNSAQAELVDILGLVLLMVGAIVFAILVLPELVKSIYGLLALSSAEVVARDLAGLITISGTAPQNITIKHTIHSSYEYDVDIENRVVRVKLLKTEYGMKGTAISKKGLGDVKYPEANESEKINYVEINKNLEAGESKYDIDGNLS